MFSFVDQIASVSAESIRGRFAVPEHFEGAPDWLLVEAIGQLVGWAAMRNSDFALRPVGATVGSLEFGGRRRPRGLLELSAVIERTDRRAILYRGEVHSAGELIADMRRCVGPLLPMESLDDPKSTRARFAALMGSLPIALWSAALALPAAAVTAPAMNSDGSIVAEFRINEDAPFFGDHFPRQHVVPATLLIEAMCRTGAGAIDRALGRRQPVLFDEIRQVKVRQFTLPGQMLRIEAAPPQLAAGKPECRVSAHADGDLVASVRVFSPA